VLYVVGGAPYALPAVALGFVVHSLLVTRVAIYGLVFSIAIFLVVGGLTPNLSVAKMAGIFAALVSVPRLLTVLRGSRWDPMVKWVAAFLAFALASVVLSAYRLWSLWRWLSLLLVYSAPLLLALHIREEGHLKMALVVLIAGCAILAAALLGAGGLSPEAIEFAGTRTYVYGVIGGERQDVNESGRILCIGLFACIFLLLVSRGLARKLLAFVMGLVMVVGILAVKGRACWVFAPLAILGGIVWLKGVGMGKRLLVVVSILLLGGAFLYVAATVGLLGEGIRQRLLTVLDPTSRISRLALWKGFLNASVQRGFMGNGLDMTPISRAVIEAHGRPGAAHNDFISLLGDVGIIGLGLFVGIHLHLLGRIRRITQPWHKLFCMMVWLFILGAGLTQTDYARKYYALSIALIILSVRLDEARRERMQQEEAQQQSALGQQRPAPEGATP